MYISSEREAFVAAASERIVVQATPREKRAIMAKARKLGMPVAELMRRGASAYESTAEGDRRRPSWAETPIGPVHLPVL
jgi:hypothetical protein